MIDRLGVPAVVCSHASYIWTACCGSDGMKGTESVASGTTFSDATRPFSAVP